MPFRPGDETTAVTQADAPRYVTIVGVRVAVASGRSISVGEQPTRLGAARLAANPQGLTLPSFP
jgi:hypothetical protein